MNNKKLGNWFEMKMCELLSNNGYWVHFISPDARGAQPFDIIAVKNNHALAIDCKTCVANSFNISRLEDNQVMAFERWLKCGNENPLIAILHDNSIYLLDYIELKLKKNVRIKDLKAWMEV